MHTYSLNVTSHVLAYGFSEHRYGSKSLHLDGHRLSCGRARGGGTTPDECYFKGSICFYCIPHLDGAQPTRLWKCSNYSGPHCTIMFGEDSFEITRRGY
ncbi:UNVERIFIED_CONTAM: hypothetical protein Slati_0877900 [Sesamum latifolium]|uniref:Uncharacterized protein n=1 Tax=Sesamum latifolium TaxID=2727402 RepID=A0AAW2XR29_9LAMI